MYKYNHNCKCEGLSCECHSSEEDTSDNKTEAVVVDTLMFTKCKFNIDKLIIQYTNLKMNTYNKESRSSVLKGSLFEYIFYSESAYLSPAINFNYYINNLISYNLENFNNKKFQTELHSEQAFTILVQNIFISIKALLDRLTTILTFYYKGLSIDSTFGRIKENGKASGLMSLVIDRKNSDDLMNFLYEEYCNWIRDIVEPRDVVIHYNDMELFTHTTHDGREFFFHAHRKIFDKSINEKQKALTPDDGYHYKLLEKSVQKLYALYDVVFNELADKEVKYCIYHFWKKDDFLKYKENDYSFE